MPRYFFHIRSEDGHLVEDLEGQEFADLAQAEENAMASAKEILAEGLLSGKPVLTGAVFEICNEKHALVLRFPFSDAATKPGAPP
ncbi:MAG: hypothetical protein EOR84_29025 [Mesorhizobium sp.]|uniref:DUF6894 family protein n=1 Tax=Mesorhizobium sp. TaxID=1871066 RepID=UPI000FEA0D76|nr:hypothetical protein [Mesorhizobium sp.]RWM87823.1 MAG: hypothetical protein EOR84_29025 [Mesorhizobium sp.]